MIILNHLNLHKIKIKTAHTQRNSKARKTELIFQDISQILKNLARMER